MSDRRSSLLCIDIHIRWYEMPRRAPITKWDRCRAGWIKHYSWKYEIPLNLALCVSLLKACENGRLSWTLPDLTFHSCRPPRRIWIRNTINTFNVSRGLFDGGFSQVLSFFGYKHVYFCSYTREYFHSHECRSIIIIYNSIYSALGWGYNPSLNRNLTPFLGSLPLNVVAFWCMILILHPAKLCLHSLCVGIFRGLCSVLHNKKNTYLSPRFVVILSCCPAACMERKWWSLFGR